MHCAPVYTWLSDVVLSIQISNRNVLCIFITSFLVTQPEYRVFLKHLLMYLMTSKKYECPIIIIFPFPTA